MQRCWLRNEKVQPSAPKPERHHPDVSDASWLRQLHSYGLLRGSFRPSAEIATLRAYLR
jgi:hypothetical protein